MSNKSGRQSNESSRKWNIYKRQTGSSNYHRSIHSPSGLIENRFHFEGLRIAKLTLRGSKCDKFEHWEKDHANDGSLMYDFPYSHTSINSVTNGDIANSNKCNSLFSSQKDQQDIGLSA